MTRTLTLFAACTLFVGCSNTLNEEGPGNFELDAMLDLGTPDMLPPPPQGTDVVINEVSATDDYVELFNRGPAVDLSGWAIADDGYDASAPDTADHRFVLGTGVVQTGARVVLEDLPFGIGGGDAIRLLDPADRVIDMVNWDEGGADPAVCRLPDRLGDFHRCRATPGSTNLRPQSGPEPAPEPRCGDGQIGPGEMCDGETFADRTCASFGLGAGRLRCADDCQDVILDDCQPADPDAAPVRINEAASVGDDFIELINISDAPVDLSGWSVADGGYDAEDPETADSRYVIPAETMLMPGAFLLLVKGVDHAFGLGGEEGVWLFDAAGALIDETRWPDGAADPAWCRAQDGMSAFETCAATPGAPNQPAPEPRCGDDRIDGDETCDGADLAEQTCVTQGFSGGTLGCNAECDGFNTDDCVAAMAQVVLNEVTSSGDDTIEIYNAGDAPADLTGWAVADAGYDAEDPATAGHRHGLAGVLDPGEYRVLIKDVDHPFGLGGEDGVRLFDAEAQLVDQAAWPDDAATTSWCRRPNATGPFMTCDAATFGASNE